MTDITIAVIGFFGLIVAPVLTYVAAVRKMSGKIATSDASDLWAESDKQRTYLDKQLERANDRIVHMEDRMARLEESNHTLREENYNLRAENIRFKEEIAELRATVAKQDETIEGLRKELDERTT